LVGRAALAGATSRLSPPVQVICRAWRDQDICRSKRRPERLRCCECVTASLGPESGPTIQM